MHNGGDNYAELGSAWFGCAVGEERWERNWRWGHVDLGFLRRIMSGDLVTFASQSLGTRPCVRGEIQKVVKAGR